MSSSRVCTTYALFIPIFFVHMGTNVTTADLTTAPLFCTAGFSIAIVVTIVTTIAAPLLLKAAYQWLADAGDKPVAGVVLAPEMASGGQ